MTGILIVRDDGVIRVDAAQPVPAGIIDAIGQLLGPPAGRQPEPRDRQQQEPDGHAADS